MRTRFGTVPAIAIAALVFAACSGSTGGSVPPTATSGSGGQASPSAPAQSAVAPGAASATAACASIQQKYPVLVGKTLTVGADPSSPGYETVDPNSNEHPSHIVGFDADLLASVAQCVGFKYTYLTMTFGSLVPALQAGRVDMVMSTLYATPARNKVINFVPYQYVQDAVLLQKGNPKNINSLSDFCGHVDAQETGTAELAVAQTQSAKCQSAGKPGVQILTFGTQDQVFEAIKNKRADFTMTSPSVVDQMAKQFPSLLQVGFSTNLPYTIAIGVQKSNDTLLNALYEGMKHVQQDGTQVTLMTKWKLDPKSLAPAQMLTGQG